MNVSLWIKCVPPTTTAQKKRLKFNGKGKAPTVFHNPKAEQAGRTYEALLEKYQPAVPVEGPARIEIDVVWPWRKGDLSSKAKQAECERNGLKWFTGKPDLDNFVKQLIDVLVQMCFLRADQDVAELVTRKFVGAEPGIRINISTLQPYSPEGRSAEFDNQGGLELVGINT